MGGIIAIMILTVAIHILIRQLRRRRMDGLARQIEDYMAGRASRLAFSVREDDVAPLHNAIAELEDANATLLERIREERSRTGDLIADISHQLKTPLASLRLYCEMDESDHMEAQVAQIERMERLIHSLLRLERLCADGYEFNFEERDVGSIILSAWEGIADRWPEVKLEISGQAVIRCDEKWLGEAFLNLMKNACEQQADGGVIRIRMETTENAFYCTMEDQGGGVNPKDLPHLFRRFYRTEKSGGAGLGLAIVHEIIGRHHGHISAANAGEGLRFTISIPILYLAKS